MVARKKSFFLLTVLLISMVHLDVEAQISLIPLKSSWKYLDNGSNQRTAWRSNTFSDATWKTGNAELGYGDGDEATIVSFGTRAASKFITTYFRKTIVIADTSAYTSFSLGLKRDDGAIVYINGSEAFRTNMPTTAVSNTTRASASAVDDGATLLTQSLSKTLFRNGNNVIAVEIHQDAPNSSDISFDLTLIAVPKTAANQLPSANAGVDQSITLPVSSVQLTGSGSDPDGTIASYAWSQVSGPATAVFSAATSAATSVTGLTTAGTYVIRLTVRDNTGAQATDDINVAVNAAMVNLPSTFAFGSSWKYLDNGTDQGVAWRQTNFNDASWKSGNGELGYGDGGEATVVGFGANSSAKFITTYFRKQISLVDLTSLSSATLRYKRDDGIVIYINGSEVLRNNMPAGTILFS
ncbi:MAG: hypothetical protein RLZZ420_1491, partial [Bacteroidota bacterium]